MRWLAFVMVLCVPALAAEHDWETVRRTVIDPLNTALHRHLPQAVKARDLSAILAAYATDVGTGVGWKADRVAVDAEEPTLRFVTPAGEEPIETRWERLLALFASVDKAELRIDRVDWRHPDPAGWPATVRLVIRGIGPTGERRQLEQHATVRVRQDGGTWRIAAEEVTLRTLVGRREPRFAETAAAAGITSTHENALSPPFRLFGGGDDNPVRQPSGVAVGDVDGDGCEDVVLAGSPELTLYRGRCDGTFVDATAASGLPRPYPAAASGVVFFDYDNDGREDLFVAAVRGGVRLFHNEGAGAFRDVTAAAHVPPAPWTSMAAIADYDRDGFLDVYLVRMGDHERTVPEPGYAARNGLPGILLHNRGDGTFADVTRRAGVGSTGWNMAGAWGDYDGDGWPDLYVANEFGGNALYHNERDGTFTDRTDASGTRDGGAGMGVVWGDYDGDGDLDLFVSGMHANSGWALFHPAFPAPIPWRYRVLRFVLGDAVQRRSDDIIDRLTRGSTLYRNDGDGRFTDVSYAAGVRDGQWGWAAEFVDYDDDGRLDIYAVDGFVSGPLLDDV